MIAAATLRRRLQQGDSYAVLGAELDISAEAMRKRASRLGVQAEKVRGWHRPRRLRTREELAVWSERRREAARARRAR